MRAAGQGAAVAGLLVATVLAVRWLTAPVVPRPAGGQAPVVSGEAAGRATPQEGFLLLHAEEVVLADGAGGGDASGPLGRWSRMRLPAGGEPAAALRLPARARVRPGAVVLVYEALALDRPVLRRVLVLDRLPAAVGGTRHLRRLAGAAAPAGRGAGPAAARGSAGLGHGGGLRVLGLAADGTVTLELAGRRVEVAPGQGWGLGWAEGRGVRELPVDAAGWREAVRVARRRGEVVTSFSVVNRGWRRVLVPER